MARRVLSATGKNIPLTPNSSPVSAAGTVQNSSHLGSEHGGVATSLAPKQAPPNWDPYQPTKPEIKIMECFSVFGEDGLAMAIYLCLAAIFATTLLAFLFIPLAWIATAAAILIGFVLYRHTILRSERYGPGRGWVKRPNPNSPVPDTGKLPAIYFLYVLGSGGHSAEMIETIKHKFRGNERQHRRYVVSSGDKSSMNMVKGLELLISDAYPDGRGGTFDAYQVHRARQVHQSKFTAIFSCIITAVHAVNALTREPDARPAHKFGPAYKYPHVIVTNGPATGFIIGAVTHFLKIFYLAPQNRLKLVYIESWARSKSLSLTGKLFRWSGITNVFCVQHQSLAKILPGTEFVSQVAARVTPVG